MSSPMQRQEDVIIRRVLCVSLAAEHSGQGTPPCVYLESLTAELKSERGSGDAPILMDAALIERVLMDRMSSPPDGYPDTPLSYLLGCFKRASDEVRTTERFKDKEFAGRMQEMLLFAKELVVSYSGLMLLMEMFPQPYAAQQRGKLQLLDHLEGGTMPPGFLEQFISRWDGEGLDDLFGPIFADLPRRVMSVSPLGDFFGPLATLRMLTNYPPLVKVMLGLPCWKPDARDGRAVENESILGPFLRISSMPDMFGGGLPSVREQCFSEALAPRTQASINQSNATLRNNMGNITATVHQIVLALLRGGQTREAALDWIAFAIEKNKGRGKMQIDQMRNATHGFFVNLGVVMMKLCEPFMDPNTGKMSKITEQYVSDGRLDFSAETKISMDSEQEASWIDKRNQNMADSFRRQMAASAAAEAAAVAAAAAADGSSPAAQRPRLDTSLASTSGGAGPGGFHFICECFFLTAASLHYGFAKGIQDSVKNHKELGRLHHELNKLEDSRATWEHTPQAREHEQQVAELKAVVAELKELYWCFESALADPAVLRNALGYCRLMCAFLVRAANPANPGRPPVPPCPDSFGGMPEWFLEDVLEIILFAARREPKAFVVGEMDEVITALVLFMGSPMYVRNPYLRAKCSEVLAIFLPNQVDRQDPTRPLNIDFNHLETLFQGHPVALEFMVPNLLRLYVDIEFTGSHNQFYEKHGTRYQIGEVVEYLWEIPEHRAVWCKLAIETKETFYIKFLNMLVNDCIFHLDESMKKIVEVREIEQRMDDTELWRAQTPQEQAQQESNMRSSMGLIKHELNLAGMHLSMMKYSSSEKAGGEPFVVPEMVERIAGMLNYFLKYLTGPERKKLKTKNPEKMGFDPKKLLVQITDVYLNIAAVDHDGEFASAIARDGRSYREEMFAEAAQVIRQSNLQPAAKLDKLEALAERVKRAAGQEEEDEAILGEPPDEFLDPVLCTLMKDPVKLPRSGVVMDRPSITRHLLSDQTDPFNRSPLTVEELVPDADLKAKIEAWIKECKAKAKAEKEAGVAAMET